MAGSFDINQAANRLHLRLDFHGVLNYSKIVFVGHSMGGLVILRELLSHRDLLPRVPVVVFYATPQEGAQITEVARHILPNTALAQMTPAQHNTLLQSIDTDWKNIPAADRPQIRCAYENEKTHGVLIVPWVSATRLCDHGVPPIAADHLGIVKAPSAGHDTVAVLAPRSNSSCSTRRLSPGSKRRTFARRRSARIRSHQRRGPTRRAPRQCRRVELRLTLAEVSDAGLHLWPDDTPKLLPANSTTNMHIALGLSARSQDTGSFCEQMSCRNGA